jgi:hypothetical protein
MRGAACLKSIELDFAPVLSVATTRRRRPAASEGDDNTSGSSSTAAGRWNSFPQDKLLAFGLSHFDEAAQPVSRLSWDEDSDRNPNAESFVFEDEKDVLRHMSYLQGLCLRQDISGPIGLKLSSELSYQNVPEFSTFWSSTPVTASLSKKSIKVLLLILAVAFTFLANWSDVLYVLGGNGNNDNPDHKFIASHAMLLDVTTDPRDAALQARRPIRLSITGAVVQPSSSLPFGFVDNIVSNYTIFNEDYHSHIYSKPVTWGRYWELQGRHPTKDHYLAFVYTVDGFSREDYLRALGTTPEGMQSIFVDVMSALKARFRNMSHSERVGNASKLITYGVGFGGKAIKLAYRRAFVNIQQGWDGKERFVDGESIPGRILFGESMYVSMALSAWLAFVASLTGYKVAAKRSIVLIIAFCALYLLGLIAYDLETLSEAEGADSFEVIRFAIDNNICCAGRPDVIELDTEEGRSSRKQMMRDALAILVCRFLQLSSSSFFMWSLWVERHVLVNVFCFFGILFLYQGIVLPAVAPQEYSKTMLVVSVVGFLFPQLIWWRLATIRRSVDKLVQEDAVAWEKLYSEIMSRPSSKMHLEQIIHLSKMYEKKEMRQMTSVDPNKLASVLPDDGEHSWGWHVWQACVHRMERLFFKGRKGSSEVCEPIRSIDQLYLQAKTMVPYLSRLVQVWAHQSDGMFRVRWTEREAGALAAAGGTGKESYGETHNARQEAGDETDSHLAGSSISTHTDSNTASASTGRGPSQLSHPALLEEERLSLRSEPSPAFLEQVVDMPSVDAATAPRSSVLPATKAQRETTTLRYEKWRALQEHIAQGSFSGKIAFANLKLISRIIEKTHRCYKGDPSQLTDLCRAAIGFESLEDLANCLGTYSETEVYVYSDLTAQM